jgi:hypothetical protein
MNTACLPRFILFLMVASSTARLSNTVINGHIKWSCLISFCSTLWFSGMKLRCSNKDMMCVYVWGMSLITETMVTSKIEFYSTMMWMIERIVMQLVDSFKSYVNTTEFNQEKSVWILHNVILSLHSWSCSHSISCAYYALNTNIMDSCCIHPWSWNHPRR